MICAFCRAPLPEGAAFCPACGHRIQSGTHAQTDRNPETIVLLKILQEASEYEQKDDYQSELRVLSKGLRIAPDSGTLMLRLGRAWWRLGYDQKAMEYYREAERLNPGDPVIYVNIAALYISRGMYAEARLYCRRGIEMIEADPLSVTAGDTAVAYGNYALCLGELGDLAGAKKYLAIAREKGYRRESIENICSRLHLDPDAIE